MIQKETLPIGIVSNSYDNCQFIARQLNLGKEQYKCVIADYHAIGESFSKVIVDAELKESKHKLIELAALACESGDIRKHYHYRVFKVDKNQPIESFKQAGQIHVVGILQAHGHDVVPYINKINIV